MPITIVGYSMSNNKKCFESISTSSTNSVSKYKQNYYNQNLSRIDPYHCIKHNFSVMKYMINAKKYKKKKKKEKKARHK